MLQVDDLRNLFYDLYESKQFVIDKTGCRVVELIGAHFIADEESIFGALSEGYIKKELDWYISKSLNVNDIAKPIPKQWLEVSDPEGYINSNYGYLVFSEENGNQFKNVIEELDRNEFSRRAEMIYTRPSMWNDYRENGKNDFVCCNTVQYFIRLRKDHKTGLYRRELITDVSFRSNDVFSGYRNDKAFQDYITNQVHSNLKMKYKDLVIGDMFWHAGSLHIYEKDFYLLEHYRDTGEWNITKSQRDAYISQKGEQYV